MRIYGGGCRRHGKINRFSPVAAVAGLTRVGRRWGVAVAVAVGHYIVRRTCARRRRPSSQRFLSLFFFLLWKTECTQNRLAAAMWSDEGGNVVADSDAAVSSDRFYARRCRHRNNTVGIILLCLLLRTHTHTNTRLPYCKADIYIYMCVKIINDGKNSIELAHRFVVRTRSNLLHPRAAGPPVRSLARQSRSLAHRPYRSPLSVFDGSMILAACHDRPRRWPRDFFFYLFLFITYCTEIRSLPVLADRRVQSDGGHRRADVYYYYYNNTLVRRTHYYHSHRRARSRRTGAFLPDLLLLPNTPLYRAKIGQSEEIFRQNNNRIILKRVTRPPWCDVEKIIILNHIIMQ